MRSFVESFKSIFRRKKNDDEEDEEEDEQQAGGEKFKMSCKRKKKKKMKEPSATSVKPRTEPKKTKTPPPPSPAPPKTAQQSQMKSMKPPPSRKQQPAAIPTPQSTMTSPKNRRTPAQNEEGKSACVRMEANSAAPSSRYVNAPKSNQVRPVASQSCEPMSRGSSDGETNSSFRRFKQFSARAMRKVKTFVSRPVKQATVIKVAKRVEERRKMEPKQTNLTHGEDLFPRHKPSTTRKSDREKEIFLEKSTRSEGKPVIKVGTLPNGTVLVKNNDNNGELFMDKSGESRPFWMVTRRPADEDLEDSVTDDDLQLNADVIFDVMNGKVKLVPMPTIPVVLDPLNSMPQLKERDALFFNRDVLFGNTVRTMINLSDQLSRKSPVRKKNTVTPGQMRFVTPNLYKAYKPGTWDAFEEKPFIAKE